MTKETQTLKPSILAEAITLAKNFGLYRFSRSQVAAAAKVGESTVSYHFGTMATLRTEVIKKAVEKEILPILADARTSRDITRVPMSEELRKKLAAFVAR